ncbi:MAG: response regulator transcription factor [Lachnospiraceae bacterium]|jgi:two-component system alkaline phosphatase synthesis response regulator PhoP|nr:response regulator transcription factor [Lachnospiraceae bacterium]
MPTIFIVEDDKNIREIETFALKNSGYEVCEFETAGEFFAALEKGSPDLIILDIMLPDIDGLAALGQLRENKKTTAIPVIMVTAKGSEIDKVKGLDIGADDYITKPFGVMELVSRVKAMLRRSQPEGREKVLTVGAVRLDEEKHQVTTDGQEIELTFKEFELLKLLMSRAGNVTTREDILDKVWGTDFVGESRTLDMHIKTLRKKLGTAGAMIQTVRNVGYVLRG